MSTTVFKSLVDTTFDSVEGYRKAGEKAHSPALKSALAERLGKRQQTLATLNAELQRQGDELVTKGTVTGAAHRLWTDITDLFEKPSASRKARTISPPSSARRWNTPISTRRSAPSCSSAMPKSPRVSASAT
jgi:hypothetical protein